MQKIEVIVRITKGHCPPQEQTIFEWIEMNRAAPDTLNYPGLEINLEHRRVFKNGQGSVHEPLRIWRFKFNGTASGAIVYKRADI